MNKKNRGRARETQIPHNLLLNIQQFFIHYSKYSKESIRRQEKKYKQSLMHCLAYLKNCFLFWAKLENFNPIFHMGLAHTIVMKLGTYNALHMRIALSMGACQRNFFQTRFLLASALFEESCDRLKIFFVQFKLL